MLEFTLKYSTCDEVVNIPQTWGDVTLKQYVRLVNEETTDNDGKIDLVNRVSILTGESYNSLLQIPTNSMLTLFNCISFINDHEPIINSKVPDKIKKRQYESLEYGQSIAIDQLLQANYKDLAEDLGRDPEQEEIRVHRLNIGAELVEIFTRKRIDKETVLPGMKVGDDPVTEVLGTVNFFLIKLESLGINTGS